MAPNATARPAAAALAGALALCADPAAARDLADPAVAPEAVAGFAMQVCIRDTTRPEWPPRTGDFEPVEIGGTSATFVHPAGLRLELARRENFFSCRIEIPRAGEAWFEALFAAVSPAMQARFDAQDFEQVEDGLVWDITTEDGLAVTTKLQREESGRVLLISATEPTAAPASAPDN